MLRFTTVCLFGLLSFACVRGTNVASTTFDQHYCIAPTAIKSNLALSSTGDTVSSSTSFRAHYPVIQAESFVLEADRGFGKTYFKLWLSSQNTNVARVLQVEPTTEEMQLFVEAVLRVRRGAGNDHLSKEGFIAKFWLERQYGTIFALHSLAEAALNSATFGADLAKSLDTSDRARLAVILAVFGNGKPGFPFMHKLLPPEWTFFKKTRDEKTGIAFLRSLRKDLELEGLFGEIPRYLAEPVAAALADLNLDIPEVFDKSTVCNGNVAECPARILSELMKLLDIAKYHARFVLDGIDEVRVFNITTNGCQGDAVAYRNVVSSLNDVVREASKLGSLQINFFLPSCQQFSVAKVLSDVARPDKLPLIRLQWDLKAVRRAYADHVLSALGASRGFWSRRTCPSVPSFVKLVGGEACVAEVLPHIPGPRHINQFILQMMQQAVTQPNVVGDSKCEIAQQALERAKANFAATTHHVATEVSRDEL